MPRAKVRIFCKVCGRHRDEAGHISATGKCGDCAEAILLATHRSIRDHTGPAFRYWRERMAASVGGVLLDGQNKGAS